MNEAPSEPGMGEIVQTAARWLRAPILIYGLYVVLYGHVTPGGGFAGGVIIACGFILATLAGGKAAGQIGSIKKAASFFDSAGVLLFLALAAMGMWWANGAFFQNFIATPEDARFTLFSGGTIPIANIGLGLKVASALFLAFAALAAIRIGTSRDKPDQEEP